MNRKIWGIILGIFVIGIFITYYTSRFVEKRELEIQQVVTGEAIEKEPMAMGSPVPIEETEKDNVISPLETTAPARKERAYASSESEVLIEAIEEDMDLSFYEKRLVELDAQIAKMKEEEASSNSYSMKTIVDTEYKLWDGERIVVYTTILERLNSTDSEKLIQDEKDWLKDREQRAIESAGKGSGNSVTVDSLEYTAALGVLTRQRVYDLVSEYKTVLEQP